MYDKHDNKYAVDINECLLCKCEIHDNTCVGNSLNCNQKICDNCLIQIMINVGLSNWYIIQNIVPFYQYYKQIKGNFINTSINLWSTIKGKYATDFISVKQIWQYTF